MVYNPHDSFYKKAKQEGYRSRAAYKLLELQQRYGLLRAGDAVVDLGAAPGGWLQGDMANDEIQKKIRDLLARPADCVLSDLAPKLSGIRDADMARCLELNQ